MSVRIHSGQSLGVAIGPGTGQGHAPSDRIRGFIEQSTVLLFVKGTPQRPACGFSASVIDIFNRMGVPYATFDVLSDPEIRQGAKDFSSWPTFPQIYVAGELLGGSDIAMQMYESGELEQVVHEAVQAHGHGPLHSAQARPAADEDAPAVPPAARAKGAGQNEVVPVPARKAALIGLEHYVVVDVRDAAEQGTGSLPGALALPLAQLGLRYEELPAEANLLLVSQNGERSRRAGEFLVAKGYRHVYTLEGGMAAWGG